MPTSKTRLKKKDFNLLKGVSSKFLVSNCFSLKVYNTGFDPSRFAVVIPASVYKKAVQRNKTRRRFKGIIQKHIKDIKNSFAVVIYPKKKESQVDFKEIEKELMFIFKKANILK